MSDKLPPAHTAGRLTPAERETLARIRDGLCRFGSPTAADDAAIDTLLSRDLIAVDSSPQWVLSDAGRAALAAEEWPRVQPADTIDPEAWAALLRASGAYDEPPGTFEIKRAMPEFGWYVKVSPPGCRMGHSGIHADLNTAIRAAVSQADGREAQP